MEEEERPSGDAVSGMDSVASMTSGMQTPDAIELRKAAGLETPDVDVRSNKQLYTVLQQQEVGTFARIDLVSPLTIFLPVSNWQCFDWFHAHIQGSHCRKWLRCGVEATCWQQCQRRYFS